MMAKAMTDFPPSDHDSLYNRIWKTVGKKVGYGIDCDVLTDWVIDEVNEWIDTKTTEETK